MHHSIADTLRKVLCKFEVSWSSSSRVIGHFVPAPVLPNCHLVTINQMSTPPESGSGSGIDMQASINVAVPTYDWNAPDQMWDFQLFKSQFTSWKKIHWNQVR